MGAVWVLGLTRLIQGLAAGKPVLFLIFALSLVSAALVLIQLTDEWTGGGRRGPRRDCQGRKPRPRCLGQPQPAFSRSRANRRSPDL
jgi:hypothetical protein